MLSDKNFEKEQEIKRKILENEMKNIKQLKNKLLDLYLLEFEENFSEILKLDKTKYLYRFGEKMNLILEDKFGEDCFDNEEFLDLNENVEKIFTNNYYKVSYDFLKEETESFSDINENDLKFIRRKRDYDKSKT